MQFGFGAPVSGPLSGPRDLARIASDGEAIGYDYCTLSDHVVIPRELENEIPLFRYRRVSRPRRRRPPRAADRVAFVAAKTSKLRLVTSVMVVPHRPPVLTAKILATIDVLSEGRLTWGIGAGWCQRGVRGDRHRAVRRARRRHRRVRSRRAASCGPTKTPASTASTSSSPTSSSSRARSRSECRSGSAARAGRRCAVPPSSAMPGIRSAPTRRTGSTRWAASSAAMDGCIGHAGCRPQRQGDRARLPRLAARPGGPGAGR